MPTVDSLAQLWDRVRTGLWFLPGLIAACAMALAALTPSIDRAVSDEWIRKLPLVYSGSPAGARAVLSTVATSMITTAGVVFSMTIVSLQLASSQFGPRLLRTFLRDRGNQVVLGTFVGVFLYCILVLPTVEATSSSEFVPHIAVTVSVLLAIVGLGMFVYFIDNVAQSIHADAVIRSVGSELDGAVDRMYPQTLGEADDSESDVLESAWPSGPSQCVSSTGSGYLRFVNGDALIRLAAEHDVLIRIEAEPGSFLFDGSALASVRPSAGSDELAESVREAFVLGAHRTPLQDLSFVFEQLSEMAVRALSPGIHDPTTAIHCIDRIGAGLIRLVSRRVPSPLRRDDDGNVRVLANPCGLERILEACLEPVGRTTGSHSRVWLRLLRILELTHDRARRDSERNATADLARRFAARALEALAGEDERRRVADAARWALGPDGESS